MLWNGLIVDACKTFPDVASFDLGFVVAVRIPIHRIHDIGEKVIVCLQDAGHYTESEAFLSVCETNYVDLFDVNITCLKNFIENEFVEKIMYIYSIEENKTLVYF